MAVARGLMAVAASGTVPTNGEEDAIAAKPSARHLLLRQGRCCRERKRVREGDSVRVREM